MATHPRSRKLRGPRRGSGSGAPPTRRLRPASPLIPGLLLLTAGLSACDSEPAVDAPASPPEPWVDRPLAEWPDFALTNDIHYEDTTYRGIANAFLVDTGADTVGVTAKHVFLYLGAERGLSTVDPGPGFVGWNLRSRKDTTVVVPTRGMVDAVRGEPVGDFNGLKDRDWLAFELGPVPEGVYPVKVRWTPALEPGDTVRAVGRSMAQRHDSVPSTIPLRIYRAVGSYYYVQPLDPDADPVGTSGAPVIDARGRLVGIISGAVGRLGVVGGVEYLGRILGAAGG